MVSGWDSGHRIRPPKPGNTSAAPHVHTKMLYRLLLMQTVKNPVRFGRTPHEQCQKPRGIRIISKNLGFPQRIMITMLILGNITPYQLGSLNLLTGGWHKLCQAEIWYGYPGCENGIRVPSVRAHPENSGRQLCQPAASEPYPWICLGKISKSEQNETIPNKSP